MRAAARLGLLSVLACSAPPEAQRLATSDGRYAMGTVLEATVYAPSPASGRETLEAIFALVHRFDRLMSRYEPGSDVSRLNRGAGGAALAVDPEVARLVRDSLAYGRLTGGTFDVTVGPLVRLWVEAAETDVLPDPARVQAARRRVGSDRVRIEPGGRVALLEGSSIDLGGIAKGYALDRVIPLLRERGVEAALLNFGQSSTWAVGAPPGAPGWRLLVRGPSDAPLGLVTLRDAALSVSGSLGQWVEIGGRRFGHILDPRSGEPLTRRREALVVAPSAALAEALSKALLIAGEAQGIALVAAQAGCHGLLVDADGGVWKTPAWDRAVSFEPLRGAAPSPSSRRPRLAPIRPT